MLRQVMKIEKKTKKSSSDKQLTGSQRLVLLYRYCMNGKPFSATQFAAENGIKYHLVYHYLKLLRGMGFPIFNISYGEWQMMVHEENDMDLFAFITSGKKMTRAQNLVNLYRELVSGRFVSPTAYSRRVGVSRQTVYHQLDLLSQSGIPVINTKLGWTLANYIEDKYEN